MTNRPTDAEIIKALDCCTSDKCTCLDCPYEDSKHIINEEFEVMPNGKTYDVWCCDEWLKVDLLDLIKHLKVENERLKKENEGYAELEQGCFVTGFKNIRAEAIKEFAERVKEYSKCYSYVTPRDIDNLVKEMVGDTDA